MGTGDGSSSSHASWRGTAKVSGGPAHSRSSRWTWLFLLVVLVGVFVWLLRNLVPDQITCHVLTVTTDAVDTVQVPPILYARDDVEALGANSSVQHIRGSELDESKKMETNEGLAAKLARARIGADDVLIVYICGQGVSEEETAYLYYEDEESGRYPVDDVLQQIGKCNCRVKLLVLDFGNITCDPQRGMLVNGFPMLLAKLVAGWTTDRNLWVMTSHSVGETSAVSYTAGGSVFGISFFEGLSGKADGDRDGRRDYYLTIAELYRYVRNRCHELTGGRQTPLLMHAGEEMLGLQLDALDERIVQLGADSAKSSETDEEETGPENAIKDNQGDRNPPDSAPSPDSSESPDSGREARDDEGADSGADGDESVPPATTSEAEPSDQKT